MTPTPTVTTQPVAPPVAPAEQPRAVEQPSPEGTGDASKAAIALETTEGREIGQKVIEDAVGDTAVRWLLYFEKDLANSDKQKAAEEQLQAKLVQAAERIKGRPMAENFPDAIRGMRELLSKGFFKNFPEAAQPGFRDARQEVMTSVINVFLRGHMNAETLAYLVPGGITYVTEPRQSNDKDVEWVGYFDHKSNAIEVYPRLFRMVPPPVAGQPATGEIEANTEATVLHEISHAFDRADNLLFANKSLRMIAENPASEEPIEGITAVETRVLRRMLRNPKEQQPWLPRYISAKVETYANMEHSTEAALDLITETKTEWHRIFTQSDGSFGAFMGKMLENTTFVHNHIEKRKQPGYVPAPLQNPEVAKAFHDFAMGLEVAQHPESVEQNIKAFMATHLKDPKLQAHHEQITDFFLLSASLYLRFSRLRGKVHLPTGETVDRVKATASNLSDGKYSLDSSIAPGPDRAGVGGGKGEKGLWTIFIEAMQDLPSIG